jgi:hypothetical protein
VSAAYKAIRAWYVDHLPLIEWRTGHYYISSAALIRALPDERALSELEMRAVFAEVLAGLLEWGYSESDGRFRMVDYATAALRTAGMLASLAPDERDALRTSVLWPFLSFNRTL